MKKIIWFDARQVPPDDKTMIPILSNSSIEYMVISAKLRAEYKVKRSMKFVVSVEDKEELQMVKEEDIVLSEKEELLEEAKKKGNPTAIYIAVNDKPGLTYASETGGNYDYAVIRFECETNIPLELLIAKLQSSKTVLIKEVKNAQDGKITFDVMESGADGVLLSTNDIKDVLEMDAYVQKAEQIKLQIVPGKVIEVEHVGMGYRACVDTTSMLKKNEGMFIGSFSRGGILVSSEMHYLPYMNLRPFRVNAGAVHSYIWADQGNTQYLTDLSSGSKVLVVDEEGNAREVTVGRVKIEARPLLKITVEANGETISTMVQDDWHIRLLGIHGEPYHASTLKEDMVLATYICDPGRHVGIKIEEDIIEK